MRFFCKSKEKPKTELCEQISKFMEHHREEINKAYRLLQEEIKKNEAIQRENEYLRGEVGSLCGYPKEVAHALLELKTKMDIYSIQSVVLFGMSVVRR